MTDARREWISKRAYTIWEEAGRPDGQDGEHWHQAECERDEFERVSLALHAEPQKLAKPMIEISGTAKPAKPKKAAVAKIAAKTKKSAETTAGGEPH